MSYCDFSDVRSIVDSDMENAEITDLITGIQAIQDLVLDGGGPNALVRREICRLWVALRVLLKDPNSASLGEWREDRSTMIIELKKDLREMIRHAYGGIGARYSYVHVSV